MISVSSSTTQSPPSWSTSGAMVGSTLAYCAVRTPIDNVKMFLTFPIANHQGTRPSNLFQCIAAEPKLSSFWRNLHFIGCITTIESGIPIGMYHVLSLMTRSSSDTQFLASHQQNDTSLATSALAYLNPRTNLVSAVFTGAALGSLSQCLSTPYNNIVQLGHACRPDLDMSIPGLPIKERPRSLSLKEVASTWHRMGNWKQLTKGLNAGYVGAAALEGSSWLGVASYLLLTPSSRWNCSARSLFSRWYPEIPLPIAFCWNFLVVRFCWVLGSVLAAPFTIMGDERRTAAVTFLKRPEALTPGQRQEAAPKTTLAAVFKDPEAIWRKAKIGMRYPGSRVFVLTSLITASQYEQLKSSA